MKTLIKSTLVLMTALVVSGSAFAQGTTDNADIAVDANVVAALTVTPVANLNFGDILQGSTYTIASDADSAGIARVSGATSGQSLNVTILFPDELAGTSTVLSFANYTAHIRTSGDNATPSGAAPFGSLTGQNITGTYTAAADAAHIFVGGELDNTSAGVAGDTYTGTITVTVDYN